MKKWIFYVGIGDLPPNEAFAYVDKIKDKASDFFPKDRVLYVPQMGSGSHVQELEMEETSE